MKLKPILILLVFSLVISACDESGALAVSTVESTFGVDPQFREFYNFLGAGNTLGGAISPSWEQENAKYQFTDAALLKYDPAASANQRFQLVPLGIEMGVTEPPIPQPVNQPEVKYVDGHIVHPEFVALFERMGGTRFVGRPLTELHFNPESKRYEQYFENVGFYRLEGEDPGQVHLLSYGAWKCDSTCRSTAPQNSTIEVHPNIQPPFNDALVRLGADFTGFALTEAYTAPDGNREQVFENVVLFAADDNVVGLRPIQEKLGILPEPLVTASPDPNMFFFPLQGEQGHNVPGSFLDYITRHGGFEVSGAPIGEIYLKDRVYRQCFSNLCLDYDPIAVEPRRVRPAPQGYSYKELQQAPQSVPEVAAATESPPQPTPTTSVAEPQAIREFSLQVWEAFPLVGSNQEQEIGVSVLENNVPMVNVEPLLVITLPDGSTNPAVMPPVGGDGQSRLRVAPINATNGTLIPYSVCITTTTGDKFCVKDDYLIWNTP